MTESDKWAERYAVEVERNHVLECELSKIKSELAVALARLNRSQKNFRRGMTEDDEKQIRTCIDEGMSAYAIADRIGRSPVTVSRWIKMLGLQTKLRVWRKRINP